MKGLKKDTETVDFSYDLEGELRVPETKTIINTEITERIDTLKKLLKDKTEQADFDILGHLLYGYLSMKKVVNRVS